MPTTNEAFIKNQMNTINQILGRPQLPFFLGEPCVGCLYWSDPVEQQRTLYEQQTGGAVAIELCMNAMFLCSYKASSTAFASPSHHICKTSYPNAYKYSCH